MIGSGPNGAIPHAIPGPRRLRNGDLVVLDFGFVVAGYHSDMSRTVAIGQPSPRGREVYEVVLKAQRAALRHVKAGVSGFELDKVARDSITKAGYGKRFIHTLGHGVGRNIHQPPRLSPKRGGGRRLKVGEVITIEPGIYLPRKFGVRIEDMVIVTGTGCENLTKSPKRLIV
jgi:Xaa-Pro aminopeptidase